MRLFIALILPDPLVDQLEALQSRLPPCRLVEAENLHLTLAFLGEQSEAEAELAHEVLLDIQSAPIALRLDGPAEFGGGHGKALGLGASGGEALVTLHSTIERRLRMAGLSFEKRRFRPHVTLARLKGKADTMPVLSALIGAQAGPVDCTSFGIFTSHLRPEGAWYECLADYPLG